MSTRPNVPAAIGRVTRAGFTLIELLVVLIIIAVIISIVLPALGMARKAARSATTRNMLTQITSASGVFAHDHQGRMPGYFTARQMGDALNLTQGFSAMQNIMLDLAGGIDPNQATAPATDLLVGPGTTTGTSQIYVNPDLMGSSSGGNTTLYYVPDAKHWVAQSIAGQQLASGQNPSLRSVLDDFSNPILAWVQDETAVGQVTTVAQFAKPKLTNPTTEASARFYWAANSAFLGANAMGSRGYDQTDGNSGSMIRSTTASGTATPPPDADKSLCGIMGSPSAPYRPVPPTGIGPTVPASARAPLMLHSAGADGIFLGRKDRGAKQFDTTQHNFVDYQASFVNKVDGSEGADAYHDKDGKREIYDILKAFDDITATGGN